VEAAEAAARLLAQSPGLLIVDARGPDGSATLAALAPLRGSATLIACVAGPSQLAEALAAGAADAVVLPGDAARLVARARQASSAGAHAAAGAAPEAFAVVEHAADGVFAYRRDGTVSYVNATFVSFLGYDSAEQLLQKPALDLVHPEDRERVRDRIRGIEEKREPSPPRTVRLLARDGSTRFAETRGMISGDQVVVIARDIAERRRSAELEEQLQHSQKMEVIGRLAGGIAHDFNNVLTTIRGYGDLLLERVPGGSPAYDAAQHIRRSAIRAAGLTEQLLVFTRRRPPQPRPVQLNDVVRQMGGLLTRVIGEDITLELRLQPFLPRVRADAGQMEQMILNLAINARDAMAKGGRLTIETHGHGSKRVRLTVEDDGVGMDEETRRRIFEPFFTTKAAGKGTGLGLSIVLAIVEQSGGTIQVDSEAGHGARFHVFLPRAEDGEVSLERPTPVGALFGPGGNETILLAEDDEEVREFVEHVLKRAGYHVLVAADGSSALALAEKHDGAIALLLSDVVMPRVNGRELAASLQAKRPALRVLHMSGYPGDTIARYGDVREGDAFLQKPFSAADLTRKVREILDGPTLATS
jgi:PAS domain S-box-containing protein